MVPGFSHETAFDNRLGQLFDEQRHAIGAQLSSDRTSCRSPLANQMRLILHTGDYWLLLDLRAAIPSWNPLRHTEFATIRLRLLKIASRIIEHASRIRIALASCCPEAETFSLVALKLQPSGP